ncbi:MAG TPA: sulfotransferase [Longimicrobiales bacterium]|nr:sulfotransferase [Longimicrobiales bacterium]
MTRSDADPRTHPSTDTMADSSGIGPLFITGFKRSGTTLLGNIVDRHPDISIFVECFFIPRYYYAQFAFWPLSREKNRKRLARSIATEPRSRRNGVDVDEASIAARAEPSLRSVLDTLMLDWAASRGSVRWGDKSPGFITKMHLLTRLFPDARYVHIVRDGRDVMLSILNKAGWERNVPWIAREWERAMARARAFGAAHPDRYLEVRYEALVQDPESVVREVAAFAGLTFNDRMLRPTDEAELNPALSTWGQVNREIVRDNFEKWRREARPEDLAAFEYLAGHRLREFGWPLSDERLGWWDRVKIRSYLLARTLVQPFGFVGRGVRFVWEAVRR